MPTVFIQEVLISDAHLMQHMWIL